MQSRRLVNTAKDTFVEIYWEGLEVEIVAGAIGSKGRARRTECGTVREAEGLVAAEVAKRQKAGFVEVTIDAPIALQAKLAPSAQSAPEMIAEIALHPDDDAPRLVYADYLQAQGDPRGELIVIQCERARLDRWDPKQKLLVDREDQLLLGFRRRWLGDRLSDEIIARFRRGFVDRIRLERPTRDAGQPTILDRAYAQFPLLSALALPSEIGLASIGSEAAVARLVGLDIRGALYADTVGSLAARIPRATDLAIKAAGLGRAQLRELPKRAWRALDFQQNTLGINGTRALLEALDPPAALEELDIGSSGVGDDGVRALAQLALPNLHTLVLKRSNISTRAIASLAAAPDLRRLARLDLSGNDLFGAFPAFADRLAAAMPALVELDLRGVALDEEAIAAIAASPLAAQLVSLELLHCGITARGAKLLADAAWPKLRHANLGGNPLGDGADLLRARLPNVQLALRAVSGTTLED